MNRETLHNLEKAHRNLKWTCRFLILSIICQAAALVLKLIAWMTQK